MPPSLTRNYFFNQHLTYLQTKNDQINENFSELVTPNSTLKMTWGRRIRLYLVGFGIGLIICWILFFKNGNRDLGGWLPGSRVTKFITFSKRIDADSLLICKLKCNGITIEDIRKATEKGEVDFGKSNVSKMPNHEYDINVTVKGKALEIYFSENMVDSTARILQIYPPLSGESCNCK